MFGHPTVQDLKLAHGSLHCGTFRSTPPPYLYVWYKRYSCSPSALWTDQNYSVWSDYHAPSSSQAASH